MTAVCQSKLNYNNHTQGNYFCSGNTAKQKCNLQEILNVSEGILFLKQKETFVLEDFYAMISK